MYFRFITSKLVLNRVVAPTNIGEMNYTHIHYVWTILEKYDLFSGLCYSDWLIIIPMFEEMLMNITYYAFFKVYNKKNQVCFSAML